MARDIYHFNRSNREIHRRRYRRRSLLLAVVFIIFAIAAAVVIYDVYHLGRATSKPTGVTYRQTIAGPQTFRSAYFQFSDTAKWVYAPNNSTPTKLTYLLYGAGLPVHSLIVYVNQTPLQSDLAVTRVLPVQVKNGNALTLMGDISAPCSSLYGAADLKRIKTVSLSGTSFLCVPDSPQFSAVVGHVGADYHLNLKRADGETANYIIIYHNLSIDPDPAPFVRIMKTFQAL
jgi:hypothetical protein